MTSVRVLRVLVPLFVLAIGAVIGIGLFAVSSPDDDKLRGTTGSPPRDVSTLRMPNADGQETGFTPRDGELTLAFFGFTHCPDICPTTLSDTRAALKSIGSEKADRVKVAMISIDPARDSAPVLASYVQQFFDKDSSLALRTDDQQRLQEVTKAFGAAYEIKPAAKAGGEPEVVHSPWLYAVDDTGRIHTQWSFGTPSADIAHDLRILLS